MTAVHAAAVRVLSYNVLSLRMSVPAVVAVISSCEPDVVCLQEIPRFLFWRSKIRRLASQCGLTVVAGHRRSGAVAVLVADHVVVHGAATVRLPWRFGRHRRGVACALVDVNGSRFAVASVHLSLYADERLAHLPLIVGVVQQFDAPAVVAGDINEDQSGDVWFELERRYQDAYAVAPDGDGDTFSAQDPRRRIDAIFVDRSATVLSCGVPDAPGIAAASDHRPVLASIRL